MWDVQIPPKIPGGMQKSRILCGIPGGIEFSSQMGKAGSHYQRWDPTIPTWDPMWDWRDPTEIPSDILPGNVNVIQRISFFLVANFHVKYGKFSCENYHCQTIFRAKFRNIAQYFRRTNEKSLFRKFAEASTNKLITNVSLSGVKHTCKQTKIYSMQTFRCQKRKNGKMLFA